MNSRPLEQYDAYEPLFSYGHLRANFFDIGMDAEKTDLTQFVRPECIQILREQLLENQNLLATSPNTELQILLSPLSRQCLWELQGGIMIRVLENITGLQNLLPDTHCHQTRLLQPPVQLPAFPDTSNPDTGLTMAMLLVIDLGSGNARIITGAGTPNDIKTDSTILQVAYWKNTVSADRVDT